MGKILACIAALLVTSRLFGNADCEINSSGKLPEAQCKFPSCPSGYDCTSPTIETKTVVVIFHPPIVKNWMTDCPEETLTLCWKASVAFDMRVTVEDASGVEAVGLGVSIERTSGTKRLRLWKEFSSPIYGSQSVDANLPFTEFVGPLEEMNFRATEVCARDSRNNVVCIPVS